MLHVLVKTNEMGMRKAWFICPVENHEEVGGPSGVVVYKNNARDRQFTVVAMDRIHLDTHEFNETKPVMINTLKEVNTKLKKKSLQVNMWGS